MKAKAKAKPVRSLKGWMLWSQKRNKPYDALAVCLNHKEIEHELKRLLMYGADSTLCVVPIDITLQKAK